MEVEERVLRAAASPVQELAADAEAVHQQPAR
jgi:hypothetical protein